MIILIMNAQRLILCGCEGRRETTSGVLEMQLVDLVRSYFSVLCFVYLPTDDPLDYRYVHTSPLSPAFRGYGHCFTGYITQHTLHSLRTASAYELSTQKLVGRNEGLGEYNLWRVVRGGAASE